MTKPEELRDRFAMAALTGILTPNLIAQIAYQLADEMIAVREPIPYSYARVEACQ